jgi:ribosomal protein L15
MVSKKIAAVTLELIAPHLVEDGIKVDCEFLRATGLLHRDEKKFKVIGNAKLPRAATFVADSFSAGARTAIESVGGNALESDSAHCDCGKVVETTVP